MTDRQDIDALLISALYGELTPADEARLQSHLDSHPADRTALADMTLARNAVRESRILTVQLEPPQAVSALLLQEAARRAPKMEKERAETLGWFQRFARSFMAHPAMAAAAMLVLVVGVAGLIYARRGGDHLAEQNVSTRLESPPAATAPAEPTATESAVLARKAGSAYEAQLKDDDLKKAEAAKADGVVSPDGTQMQFGGVDKAKQSPADAKPQIAQRPRAGDTYITVPRVTPQVKELEERPAAKSANRREDANAVANDEVAGRVGSVNGAGAGGAPPPKPDPATATVDNRRNAPGLTPTQTPPPPPPVATADRSITPAAPGAVEEAKDQKTNEDTAWAREIHVRVVNAVKANNCREASQLALSLSSRAPGYYAQNVENDRAVKQCVTYINAEREKEAERVQRARAQRRSTDEAAPKAAKPSSSSK